MKEQFFDYTAFDEKKMLGFGFLKTEKGYVRTFPLLDDQFTLTLTVDLPNKRADTALFDNLSEEEYVLHKVKDAQGGFVGDVRTAYENVLQNVVENCCKKESFKTEYARKLIVYVREKYGDELEFLWDNYPRDAIWRHKETGKWYGALLTAKEKSLAFSAPHLSEDEVEVLDLKCDPALLPSVVNGQTVLPGYHMNKKHWISVLLDGSLPFSDVVALLDQSYLL